MINFKNILNKIFYLLLIIAILFIISSIFDSSKNCYDSCVLDSFFKKIWAVLFIIFAILCRKLFKKVTDERQVNKVVWRSIVIILSIMAILLTFFLIKNVLYRIYYQSIGPEISKCYNLPGARASLFGSYTGITKSECLQKALEKEGNMKKCEQLDKINIFDFSNCVAIVAGKEKNLELCSLIENNKEFAYEKNLCIGNVTVSSNDSELCRNITKLEEKFPCYENFIDKNQNYVICDEFTDLNEQQYCYEKFMDYIVFDRSSPQKINIQFCEKFTTSKIYNGCIYNVIRVTEDRNLCGLFKDEIIKDECNKNASDFFSPLNPLVKEWWR